jgi:hypothetical protein
MYFQSFSGMLEDPASMRNLEAVRQLSRLKGGFFIPRADITSADLSYKPEWGLGTIPHSGRITIRLASGGSREFILLGSVNAKAIQQSIR